MELTKQMLYVTVLSFVVLVVDGCGRLKCYKCNSQDSPNTCGESNFDASAHAGDTVTGGTLRSTASAGSSCIKGWATNDQGTYFYRDKANQFIWDGCRTPEMCACNEDLCNSKGSRVVSMTSAATTALLFSSLAMVLVKMIIK